MVAFITMLTCGRNKAELNNNNLASLLLFFKLLLFLDSTPLPYGFLIYSLPVHSKILFRFIMGFMWQIYNVLKIWTAVIWSKRQPDLEHSCFLCQLSENLSNSHHIVQMITFF